MNEKSCILKSFFIHSMNSDPCEGFGARNYLGKGMTNLATNNFRVSAIKSHVTSIHTNRIARFRGYK